MTPTGALWKLATGAGTRWAFESSAGESPRLLPREWSLAAYLAAEPGARPWMLAPERSEHLDAESQERVLPPLDGQPIWAAGVTFPRSRQARNEEAPGTDVYDRVYAAERPELFLKCLPGQSRGHRDEITIRPDSTWDVPEPELAVLLDPRGRAVAWTLANDVSSRSIEGENPLYLPQAKIWDGSCSVGPRLVLAESGLDWATWTVGLTIERGSEPAVIYRETVELRDMRRSPEELASWLMRAQHFPAGVLLLCGTSIVPTAETSLMPGDRVRIESPALGRLENVVSSWPAGSDRRARTSIQARETR